jgi:hypothetical protein
LKRKRARIAHFLARAARNFSRRDSRTAAKTLKHPAILAGIAFARSFKRKFKN